MLLCFAANSSDAGECSACLHGGTARALRHLPHPRKRRRITSAKGTQFLYKPCSPSFRCLEAFASFGPGFVWVETAQGRAATPRHHAGPNVSAHLPAYKS